MSKKERLLVKMPDSNFNELTAKIAAKRAELDALQKKFIETLKSEFALATKFFFEETGVQAVIWNQYTPSFNDGEPCTFSLGDAVFVMHDFDSNELQSANDYEDDDLYGTIPYSTFLDTNDHELSGACKSFNELLSSLSDVLESMFGSYGTTVYLTKDGTFEAEYDCGY